ncbi:hypothetical protein CBR_g37757 [Chara braunii]|uniref:Cation-transporting P-type ATPase N-terminal domain-containing protein n=1 Tax=Chara braunii TaxID=69332 RepID=A0A388LNI8_CHABU|nr:hypothetical protein CBR_g37757 [Chara braunii]|eukprot:GBG83887.1 hypothetical protein CBR_g37757 [Chara braunii]
MDNGGGGKTYPDVAHVDKNSEGDGGGGDGTAGGGQVQSIAIEIPTLQSQGTTPVPPASSGSTEVESVAIEIPTLAQKKGKALGGEGSRSGVSRSAGLGRSGKKVRVDTGHGKAVPTTEGQNAEAAPTTEDQNEEAVATTEEGQNAEAGASQSQRDDMDRSSSSSNLAGGSSPIVHGWQLFKFSLQSSVAKVSSWLHGQSSMDDAPSTPPPFGPRLSLLGGSKQALLEKMELLDRQAREMKKRRSVIVKTAEFFGLRKTVGQIMREKVKAAIQQDIQIVEHTWTTEKLCQYYKTDPEKGLTAEQVDLNQKKFGENRITPPQVTHWFIKYLAAYTDFFAVLLMVASVLCLIIYFLDTNRDQSNVSIHDESASTSRTEGNTHA